MTARKRDEANPIARPMEVFGDRWTLPIVAEILVGHRRFGVIQRRLGLARTVLSARLQLLVDNDLVTREQYHSDPDWFEYHLTASGRALAPVVAALAAWDRVYLTEAHSGAVTPEVTAIGSHSRRPPRQGDEAAPLTAVNG